MIQFRHIQLVIVTLVLGTSVLGCGRSGGPPLSRVTGTVKLDGQPLPNASITFEPLENGRPSTGVTDSGGYYSLEFAENVNGATLGKHVVQISTWQEGYDNGTWHAAKPELVPANYNVKSKETPEMTREVTGSSIKIDFDLNSKIGPIAYRPQPGAVATR